MFLSAESAVSELSLGLDSLKDQLTNPPEGTVNKAGAEKLLSDCVELINSANKLIDGPLALLSFVFNLKADQNDSMGKRTLGKHFWECLPEVYRPSEGDTFQKVYSLQKILKEDVKGFEEIRNKTNTLTDELADVEHECKLIVSGQGEGYLIKIAHPSWHNIFEPTGKPPAKTLRWGDVSSSSEDELLACAISSLSKKSEKKTPGVDFPEDFEDCFPTPAKKIIKFCDSQGWEFRLTKGTRLRDQGFVEFKENPDGTIDSSNMGNNQILALASFYAAIASMSIQPKSLVEKGDTEVAVTYVCSLIAKHKLSEDNPELLKIALKNGDGGKAVLRGRFYFLTKTGSTAIKLIIEGVEKILEKFAREFPKDQITKDILDQITDRAFTSIDGMMENSYRTAMVDAVQYEEKLDRKGKTSKVQVKVKKLHRVVPDLTSGTNPLKPEELSKLNEVKEKFNDRKTIINKRIADLSDTTILSKPKICREVVLEAYSKLQNFKTIMKDRVVRIRSKATALNNGTKPTPANWAQAKAEVLAESLQISDSVWDGLRW
jgi:hypothetical protein